MNFPCKIFRIKINDLNDVQLYYIIKTYLCFRFGMNIARHFSFYSIVGSNPRLIDFNLGRIWNPNKNEYWALIYSQEPNTLKRTKILGKMFSYWMIFVLRKNRHWEKDISSVNLFMKNIGIAYTKFSTWSDVLPQFTFLN